MLDVVGDLVEKLRKGGQVYSVQGLKPLPKENTERWAVPVYDFGHVLSEDAPDYIGKERESRAVAEAKANERLRIHPSFVFVARESSKTVVWLAPEDGDSEAYIFAKFGNRQQGWYFDNGRMLGHMSYVSAMVSWLLLNKVVRYEIAEDSILRRSINKGRVMGGKSPLQPVRVVHLNKVVKIGEAEPKPYQGGSHRSPVPHDRAPNGYERTYKKTGLTKWYPGPIKVKGGKEAAGPETYKVVNN